MSAGETHAGDASPSSIASLVGAQHEPWSLARAVDALGAAARQAGRPSLLWLVGFFYPTLSLGFANAIEFGLNFDEAGSHFELQFMDQRPWTDGFWSSLAMTLFLLPIIMRLVPGLARISTPQVWATLAAGRRAPRVRDAWAAGKGHVRASLGLWLQLLLMLIGAGVVLVVCPLLFLRGTGLVEGSWPFRLLLGPFVVVWLIYGLLLSVIYQLALHSLAQNRRGVASALIHAWRLARNDPWATARTTLVDFLLYVTVLVLQYVVSAALVATCIGIPLAIVAWPMISGFAGVTRAAYWARAYRALGGLSPDDQVPGLAAAPPRGGDAIG